MCGCLRADGLEKANQLGNEESIEAIIRKRTLDGEFRLIQPNRGDVLMRRLAFRSRCPFFVPAASDAVGRGWWDLAESGKAGKGPDLP